jgi:hypothetical protein
MKPFLVREPIGQYESLRGYAMRMGALNQSPAMVVPHLVSLSAASEALPTLAGLTATEQAVLASRMTQQGLGEGRVRVAQLGRTSIGHRAVRWQERYVCPACVEEGIFSSVLWELDAYMVCCTHELVLMNRCKACRKPLLWESAPFDSCSCGHLLCDLDRREAPDYEVMLSLHIRASALSSLGGSVEEEMPDQAYLPVVLLDALLLFVEFGSDKLAPVPAFASPRDPRINAMLKDARKTLATAACESATRRVMCGDFGDESTPIVLAGHALSDRDVVELRWMFAGQKPPDDYPRFTQMAHRRRRWQGIAPAIVVADPRDWGER